jgi:hypothetical protein
MSLIMVKIDLSCLAHLGRPGSLPWGAYSSLLLNLNVSSEIRCAWFTLKQECLSFANQLTHLHVAVHCFFNPHIMLQASWKYDRGREWASVELHTKLVFFRKFQKLFAYGSESWDEVGSIVWWRMDSEVQARAMNYNVKQLTSLAHRRRMTKLKWIVGLYTLQVCNGWRIQLRT